MTYVVTGKCVNCRYTDCVEVCPVSCFYMGENSVVINPDECIDCGVCEPECPIEAIKADRDLTPDEEIWADHNKKFSAIWLNITDSQAPLPCADDHKDKSSTEKLADFSEKPGDI